MQYIKITSTIQTVFVYNNTNNLIRIVNSLVEEIYTWKLKYINDLVAKNQSLLGKDRLRI